MRPLRVGIVDYLNSRPLAWGFLQGMEAGRVEPVYLPPAQVADRLAAGRLDVGLIPSIEVQRIGGLGVVPGLCVASEREVRSVLLVARRPLAKIESVALDANSRTSAALVRILFAERWGIEPVLREAEPDVERMLAASDAALVIGDPALGVDRRRCLVFDLAREWYDLTGLPFVFAVWAARPEVEAAGLEGLFRRSLQRGREDLAALAEAAAAELGLEAGEVVAYLTRNLRFDLGAEELAGLEEFYRRAHAHGLLDQVEPLRFCGG